MSKARIIGAGTAGSTNYNANVNLNTAGGPKKQGYPSAVGDLVNNRATNTRARGENNNIIFPMNQMQGGVHKPIRIYDGTTKFAPYDYYQPKGETGAFLHFPLAQGAETWADGAHSLTVGAASLVYNGNTTTWANIAAKISESRALFTPTDDFTLSVNNRVAMHSGGNITTVGQVTGTALGATLFDIRGAGYLSTIGHLILGSTSAKSTVITYSSGTKGLQVNPLGAVAFDSAAAVSAGVVTLQDGAFGTAGQVLTSQGGAAPPTWTTRGSQNLASVLTAGNVADADQTIQLSRAAYSKRPYGTQTILNDSGGVFQIKSQLSSTPDESIVEFKVNDTNLSLVQNDTITGVIDEIDIQTTSIRVGKTDPTLNTIGMADTIDIYPSYLVVQQDRTGLTPKSNRFTANGIGIYDGNNFQYGTAGQILTSGGETGTLTWADVGATTLEEAITNGSGVANSSFKIQEAGTSNYSQMARDGFTAQNVTTFFPPFTTTTTSNLSPTSLVLTNLTNGSTVTATLEKDSLAYAGGSYEAEYTKDHMRVYDENGGQPKQTSIYPNQINLYDSTFAGGSRSLIIERNKFQIGIDLGAAGQVLGKDVGGNLAWTTPKTPNLQQVCDVGSTTATGITVQVGAVSAQLDEASLTFSGGATIASGSLAISAAGTDKDLSLDTTDGDISVTVKGVGRTFTVSAPILQINQGTGAAGEVLTYQADGSADWAAVSPPSLASVLAVSPVADADQTITLSAATTTNVMGANITITDGDFEGNNGRQIQTDASAPTITMKQIMGGANNECYLRDSGLQFYDNIAFKNSTFDSSVCAVRNTESADLNSNILAYTEMTAGGLSLISTDYTSDPSLSTGIQMSTTDASIILDNDTTSQRMTITPNNITSDGDNDFEVNTRTLNLNATHTLVGIANGNEYPANPAYGDALLVYNDVGVDPGVSDGFAEVIFQNISPTAQSSNIIAICEKDGDYMAVGQVSQVATPRYNTLFEVRGAGYTSSSGHQIIGTNSSSSADKSVVITYENGSKGMQVNPNGALGWGAEFNPVDSTLQGGAFGTDGQFLKTSGSTAAPVWSALPSQLDTAAVFINPSDTLQISDGTSTGAAGQVLTSDGAYTAWSDVSSLTGAAITIGAAATTVQVGNATSSSTLNGSVSIPNALTLGSILFSGGIAGGTFTTPDPTIPVTAGRNAFYQCSTAYSTPTTLTFPNEADVGKYVYVTNGGTAALTCATAAGALTKSFVGGQNGGGAATYTITPGQTVGFVLTPPTPSMTGGGYLVISQTNPSTVFRQGGLTGYVFNSTVGTKTFGVQLTSGVNGTYSYPASTFTTTPTVVLTALDATGNHTMTLRTSTSTGFTYVSSSGSFPTQLNIFAIGV